MALARGLFAERPLLILDEPTAAIDPQTEVELIQRMMTFKGQVTTVVISHRLGVSRNADRILVMDEGRLVEQGTHSELLTQNGLYAAMWRAQAGWYGATLAVNEIADTSAGS